VPKTDDGLLAHSVYRNIRERIVSGELAPGQALSIPALAAELEVSRSPVRESVLQLVSEGIAVSVPYAGARVARIDDQAMRQVFEVREILDGLAAQQAAARLSNAELAELRAMVGRQDQLVESSDDERRDALVDLEFHAYIRDRSGNEPLKEALCRLEAQSHLRRSEMWRLDANRRLALREHWKIVAALESGDPAAACHAARSHVAGLLVRMTRA
jgi:DNA-binding GntR family transcriptional regulator